MDGNETGSEQTVCVIGGGLLGLFSALTLQEQRKQVHLIEREEVGGRQGASFGNGCWINPGAIMPISVPGLWREVPGYLIDPDGPFTERLNLGRADKGEVFWPEKDHLPFASIALPSNADERIGRFRRYDGLQVESRQFCANGQLILFCVSFWL